MDEIKKPEKLLTPKEVQEYLSISDDALHRLVKRRALPVVRISARVLRFKRADVERFVESRTRQAVRRSEVPEGR